MPKLVFSFVTVIGAAVSTAPSAPLVCEQALADLSYEETIEQVAAAIEELKPEHPQLVDFSAQKHCDRSGLVISYQYKTHRAPSTGGWTSGVPHPDADGIWFSIDFHDPDSKRQIHTQPVVPRYRYKDMEVMLLILEGSATKKLEGSVVEILLKLGVEPVT